MTEHTTQGSETQALDPELASRLKAELDRARAEMGENDAARAEIEPTYSELVRRMGDLEERAEALALHIEAIEVLLGERPFHRSGAPRRMGHIALPSPLQMQMQIVDAVVALLEEVGEPLHYRDIHQRLEERGHRVDGVDPAATLLSRFFKDPRLYRPRRGTYGLVEWLDREDDQPAGDRPDATDRLAATRRFIHGGKSQFRWDHDVLGAAERALRDEDAPMRPSDLTKKMIAMGTWKPLESTPKSVVSQRLSKDISEKGERSRFRRVRYGLYGLSEWGDSE